MTFGVAVRLCEDFSAGEMRALAARSKDGPQARRLLALAAEAEGRSFRSRCRRTWSGRSCGAWGSATSRRGRAITRKIRKPLKILKKFQPTPGEDQGPA